MIPVFINCGAGTGHDESRAAHLREVFAAHGLQADVTLAHDGPSFIAAVRAAVEGGAPLVVAGGGDGTLNAAASVLAGSDAALGVLPLGTLNHFARDLGIPPALEDAVKVVAAGHLRRVDVGEVNGKVFINNSSLGLYADIVRDREQQQRRLGRGKWTAALWATLAALRRFPFLSLRLNVDGARHPCRTPFVFIGNNAYTMEGLAIGERKVLDGGRLSLYFAQRPGRLSLVRFAWRALRGTLAQARDFDILFVENMQIETRHRKLRVAMDGEVALLPTPLVYRIRPKALTVLAPP